MIIKKFYSTPAKFDVTFKNGLNIICADISETSTSKSSRNGTGKTTFLKLIDFCLLANLDEKIIESQSFKGFEFTLECEDKNDKYYKIRRKVSSPDSVFISIDSDDFEEKTIEEAYFFFNEIFFDVSPTKKTELTFRTLMNYIMRGEGIGFTKEFYHFPFWNEYMKNAVNLYLTGLNFELPLEKQHLNTEKDAVAKTIFGLKKYLEDNKVIDKATLKSEFVLLDNQIKERMKIIDHFKVLDEYHEMEKEADTLTREIKLNQNLIFTNNEKLQEYKEAIKEDIPIDVKELEDFYKSINLYLSDSLKHKMQEIIDFHTNLIKNRNNYLAQEIKRLEAHQKLLREKLEQLDIKRASIMRLLETHGALSEYNQLIQRLDEDKSEREFIKKFMGMYEDIANYNKEKDEITDRIKENNSNSEEEVNKRGEAIIKNLILTFKDIYDSILDVKGILVVGIKEKYKVDDQVFELKIEGERDNSLGIKKSRIFVYDLSILLHNIFLKRRFPRFLIHDGIFHGVEAKQEVNALNYVNQKSEKETFQYITTINSCDFREGFDYKSHMILKIDDSEKGCLMGFKF